MAAIVATLTARSAVIAVASRAPVQVVGVAKLMAVSKPELRLTVTLVEGA